MDQSVPVASMNSAKLGLFSVSGDDPAGSKYAVPVVSRDDIDEDDVTALVAASSADMVEAAIVDKAAEDVWLVVDVVEFAEL